MSQLKTQPRTPSAESPAVILSCAGLAKRFRMGDTRLEVLKKVDLSVRAGEFLAIEGRSGSGKSTLLHILGLLDVCDGGKVIYDGVDLLSLSAAARSAIRNKQFGFVFQFYHLLPDLNVLENTLLVKMIEFSVFGYFPKRKEFRRRAVEVLTSLGMGHRLKHRPNQLSGGERQRVAIARALMNQPRVLFADEPTGNLDAETGRQIMAVLEDLHVHHGQTIIMVTHDRALAHRADRTLLLRDGVLQITDTSV